MLHRYFISGDVNCCYDCHYYLHESCAKLEDEIIHFYHSFHFLKLHGIADDGALYCYVCQTRCLGFTYRCTDCDFKMEVKCALKSEIRFPIHNHKLNLQVSDADTEPSFFCDFCHILDVTVIEDGAYIVRRIVISRSILTALECL